MTNKYKNSFKRPKPTIKPRATGLDLIDPSINIPIDVFHENTRKIRDLLLENKKDDNILRYCIILICGSVDKYMHDIVKIMLLQIFKEKAPAGKSFDNFMIPISLLKKFDKIEFDPQEKEKILSDTIYELTSSFTMQKSYAIDRNLGYIINFNIWKAIHPRIFMRFKDLTSITALKKFVDDLADRRNIIAHELDFQPNSPDKRPIDYDYVLHTLNVIQFMIEAANYQIIESIKNGQKQDINMDEKI